MFLTIRNNSLSDFDTLFNSIWDDSLISHSKTNALETDIEKSQSAYHLTTDMPRVKREDITISYENKCLKISVSQNKEEQKTDQYILKERKSTQSQRSFYLPDIDESRIEASLKDGVLNIKAPFRTKEETRRIEIK